MTRQSIRNVWAITTSSIFTKSGVSLFPMYSKETVEFLKRNVQFRSIMMLDDYKECSDIFMALHNKYFEIETEDMLLREIIHCKRNLVKDMRQHLLEAIVNHHFNTEGSTEEIGHYLQKYEQSVDLYKSMHSYSKGPFEYHVKNMLK
mmetsp:Transcript_24661/g.37476  ORF Transcript_24661/g.37476 Transcript_24661/m.37476 type:complete len:147 (-) Transcript_24661:54-494(-)